MATSRPPRNPIVSHQTVRIARGAHRAPEDGACVMELASMLAGERFSDHPMTACPVIGGVLRCYNDALDDERRQDLLRYASAVVGTASAGPDVVRRRRQLVLEWSRDRLDERHARRPRWLRPRVRAGMAAGSYGQLAVGAVRRRGRVGDAEHEQMLGLLDELVAIGRPEAAGPLAAEAAVAPAAAG